MRRLFSFAALLTAFAAATAVGQSGVDIRLFDRNNNNRLDSLEIASYATGQGEKNPATFTTDALATICGASCTDVSLHAFSDYVELLRVQRRRLSRLKEPFGWPGLSIQRKVTDPLNPREDPFQGPGIISGRWDFEADTSWVDLVAGVQLLNIRFGGARHTYAIRGGVDFDVNTGRKASDNKVRVSFPAFTGTWVWRRNLESLVVAVTPAIETDDARKRDIREIAVSMAPGLRKPCVGLYCRIHFSGSPEPDLRFTVFPSASLEYGDINRTGGNAKLQSRIDSVGSTYTRVALRGAVLLVPRVPQGLRIRLEHTYRHDFTASQDYHNWDWLTTQDVAGAGTVQLTALFRRGRTPPLFEKVDRFLIGIGVRF
jgi:hypothetical protein